MLKLCREICGTNYIVSFNHSCEGEMRDESCQLSESVKQLVLMLQFTRRPHIGPQVGADALTKLSGWLIHVQINAFIKADIFIPKLGQGICGPNFIV